MENNDVRTLAFKNFLRLGENTYPGRGIVIGTSQDGQAVQIYWIMGRSENSRNRVFGHSDGRLFTETADRSKVKDSSLTIYNAMDEFENNFVVSNGDQTDTVIALLKDKRGIERTTLRQALLKRQHEPDKPNYTPRITGLCTVLSPGTCYAELSLLRRSELIMGELCERSYYEYKNIAFGFGFCITTYESDGNPLPPFQGGPYPLPMDGDIEEVAVNYWRKLNADNRVSLAVKFINLKTGKSEITVKNRNIKVEEKTVVLH